MQCGYLTKARIGTEQLIAADAGQCHFESLTGRGLGNKPGVDAVDGWLVHCVQQLRAVVGKVGRRYAVQGVLGAQTLRDLAGQFRLIELGTGIFGKANRECAQFTSPGCAGCQHGGVQPGGQEDAHWNICHHVRSHAVSHGVGNGLQRGIGCLVPGALNDAEPGRQVIKGDRRCGLALGHLHPVTGW